MKNNILTILNAVFTGAPFVVVFLVFFGSTCILIDSFDRQHEEVSICYSQNMVRVKTDAGMRCVMPSALVEIKQ